MSRGRFDNDEEGIQPGPEVYGLPAAEREYLVPAKDGQGRSVRVMCRLSPEHSRLINEVFQSHKWPFRVQGDIYRFAIVSTIKKLAAAGGLEGSVIAHGEILRNLLADEEYQLQWEENFRMLRRVIDKYMARGAPAKARELVARSLQVIRAMKAGYWRDQYEQEVLKRYGYIIDGDTTPRLAASTTAEDQGTINTPGQATASTNPFDPDDHTSQEDD